jgi:Glycosyl hydrolases family 32 N-terminal domain.
MKKYTLTLLVAFLVFFSLSAKKVYLFTSFNEPATEGLRLLYSHDGYKWKDLGRIFLKPEVGEKKIMRDPSMVQGPDGTFHLVWTCGWKGDRTFGYASSKDLIHWSAQREIPVMMHEPDAVNVWAPEIFYDDENKEYIIVWATTIPFRFAKGQEEENNNHRLYYTKTKDFKTFTPAALFYDPGFSVIDAMIVKRGKGDYVQVVKDNTRPNRNIFVCFGKTPLGPWTNPSPRLTGFLTEGPNCTKVGKDYLIYFDDYKNKCYGAIRTRDFKTFTDINDKISVPEGHKHGTILIVDEKVLKGLRE